MERNADDGELPSEKAPPQPPTPLSRTIAGETNFTSSTTSSSSSSSRTFSPPDFLRQIQAAIRRHKPLGTMQPVYRPSRILISQTNLTKCNASTSKPIHDNIVKRSLQSGHTGAGKLLNVMRDQRKEGFADLGMGSPEDCLLTGTTTTQPEEPMDHFVVQKDGASELKTIASGPNFPSDHVRNTPEIRMEDICSYLGSLALTEVEGCSSTSVENRRECVHQNFLSKGPAQTINNLEKRDQPDAVYQYAEPFTRCSVVGSSCATHMSADLFSTLQSTHALLAGQAAFPTHTSSVPTEVSQACGEDEVNDGQIVSHSEHPGLRDHLNVLNVDEGDKGKAIPTNLSSGQKQACSTSNKSSNVDSQPSQRSKVEKASRKKKYDPDVFFKVNGKLYQKLGKIGSGGSSEVHKVIASDCTIYALKKIKLKGRDYQTAYGFCQEIEYLKILKGKKNIIQLIDYEVTDKTLLQDVVDDSNILTDGKIKEYEHIYMVLEYGEIDLAHMLLQKWKEMEDSDYLLDENWLRFYWQQMLEAVNTIHEKRIVHSDLKPANFLLVRGSLKLIDFGIAKAIMSDTTNVQRDAQVGTLNYMSPEAFMWNECDANENTIKCGRPSDVWSLGCILYQMVYGRTPFAEYKTFWSKFKVITDRNHEIIYEPVSNPCLIDLMRQCLVWDRNERWRISQLLKHPFLVPSVPRQVPSSHVKSCRLLMRKVEMYLDDPEVSILCSKLHEVVRRLEQNQMQTKMET